MHEKVRTLTFVGTLAALAAVGCDSEDQEPRGGDPDVVLPEFQESALVRPEGYREWNYVSTGLGMSYAEEETGLESLFDNVFVTRNAYASFKEQGIWPEGTMFVLELRLPSNEGAILKHGQYQSDRLLVEASVKDSDRFDGGWGYFSYYPGEDGSLPDVAEPNPRANCFSCHEEHAQVDFTFAQFYPSILEIAEEHGTVKPPAGE